MKVAENLPVPIRLPVPVTPPGGDGRIPLGGARARADGPAGRASFLLPLVLAVAAAIGISVLLWPRGQEEALLLLEAGDAAGARAVLESRYAAGENSPGTVRALARARAETGDLQGALALLEPLARDRPREREILEALVAYRRQLPGDRHGLLHALTMLEAVAPSADRLREIAGLHGALGHPAEQRAALARLVDSGQAQPAEHVLLARLSAAAGAPAAGLAVLQRLAQQQPSAVDAHAAALMVSLRVQNGQPEAAAAAARTWLASQPPQTRSQAAPMLASFLGAAGRPDLSILILEPLATEGAPSALVLALAQAEIDAQREARALERLERFSARGEAAAREAVSLRLRLALALGETDRAFAAAESVRPGHVPADLVLAVAGAAVDGGRVDLLRRLHDWGGSEVLSADPPLAAEAALILGDVAAARRWSAEARGHDIPDTRRALGFAEALVRLGEGERASAVLGAVATRAALTPTLLAEVARRFIHLNRAEDGAALLGRLRREQPSSAAEGAWLLVAAAVPALEAEVAAAIDAMAGAEAFPDLLRDVLHVAVDAGALRAAIAAARQLLAQAADDGHRMLLARLLMDAGRPGEALDVLRPTPARGEAGEALYQAALTEAWRTGDGRAAEELRGAWSGRLAAATTDEDRAAALAMLAELGAQAEMLPLLRSMAEADPARWLWTYSEAARRAGRSAEATALWAEISSRPRLPAELRRQIAFGLLERGARPAAEAAFRMLAATAPPDSQEVRQLLFVWGARPPSRALDWLEARARGAAGAERAAWMKLLTERGGALRAVAVFRGGREDHGPVWDAYVAALQASNDRARLAAAAREELDRQPSAERLRTIAALAGQSGDAALEERALRALVLAGGGDQAVRIRVGMAAYRDNDLALAERLLAEQARSASASAETLFVLGEIRERRGDRSGARGYQEAALRRLPAAGGSAEQQRMRATLLRRVGRGREALPIYEGLLARQPGDRNLRADFVSLLIDEGDYGRAQAVLAGR